MCYYVTFCSRFILGPTTVSSAGMNISLIEQQSSTFSCTVYEGNPPSNITGPLQPNNGRVSISSDGMVNINMVGINDAGTHIATWRNGIGEAATFTVSLVSWCMFLHENHAVETVDPGTFPI